MVKSGMMLITGREKTDMAMGWMLQSVAETVVGESKRES
jgi:hypothetical protein